MSLVVEFPNDSIYLEFTSFQKIGLVTFFFLQIMQLICTSVVFFFSRQFCLVDTAGQKAQIMNLATWDTQPV